MVPPRFAGQLCDALRALGVVPGDLLMVHASMKKLGPVEGGAVGVIAYRSL